MTAVAYVDPGNFATNIAAGSGYGYLLVWVVVVSNVMAMLIQYLSAKAGVATGLSLPALCREHLPRPVVKGLWGQAELVAIATDLAEVVGGALALKLLFDLPLLVGGTITAVVAFALLAVKGAGHRHFETVIIGLLGVILVGFVYDIAISGVDAMAVLDGTLPRFDGIDSVVLAAGMLGATVMPHAIYLHSALTSERLHARTDAARRTVMRGQRIDVVTAMTIAGLMNLSLLLVAASALSGRGIDTIEGAYAGLGETLGTGAALLFALGLLASGFASSSVGTLSGQVVMEGFLRRRVPLTVPAPRHAAAGGRRPRPRCRPDRCAGGLAGRAVVRHPLRAGAAGVVHRAPRRDGVAGQPAGDDRGGSRGRGGDHRPQRRAARAARHLRHPVAGATPRELIST